MRATLIFEGSAAVTNLEPAAIASEAPARKHLRSVDFMAGCLFEKLFIQELLWLEVYATGLDRTRNSTLVHRGFEYEYRCTEYRFAEYEYEEILRDA